MWNQENHLEAKAINLLIQGQECSNMMSLKIPFSSKSAATNGVLAFYGVMDELSN